MELSNRIRTNPELNLNLKSSATLFLLRIFLELAIIVGNR